MSEKIIKINEKTFVVKFPLVWQLMEIENIKMSLTNDKYTELSFSALKTHRWQLDSVDTIAYFQVLIPDLKTHFGVRSLRELDAFVLKDLTKVYINDFLPWFKPLMDDLLTFEEEENVKETESEQD